MLLVDSDRIADAGEEMFDPASWAQQTEETARGGRGAVWFVSGKGRTAPLHAVLRHYRRGGLVARIMHDRYFWAGVEQSRPFREFRLMHSLWRRGLTVPRPLAARVQRIGLTYRGDILIERVADARTLAQRLPGAIVDTAIWQSLGACIGRFQAVGAFHADLNAHNILVDGAGACWLIDFDRGQLMRPASTWQDANLARLLRSLTKLGATEHAGFKDAWSTMIAACHSARERLV